MCGSDGVEDETSPVEGFAEDPGFHSGEGGAEAVVDAVAEGEVVAGAAGDVEAVGVGEVAGIAVGGSEADEEHGAGGKVDAGHGDGAGGGAEQAMHGGVPPEDFLDGGGEQVGAIGEELCLVGVRGEGGGTVADQVRGGFVAGDEEQDGEQGDLGCGEGLGVVGVARRDEAADEIVARFVASALDDGGQVAEHLRQGLLGLGGLPAAGQCADEGVRPPFEVVSSLGWDAEQFGDDDDRERERDLFDEVAVTVSGCGDEVVDQGVADAEPIESMLQLLGLEPTPTSRCPEGDERP